MKKGFLAGLFPAFAEKFAALMAVEDLNALEMEAQEVQNRLDAQAEGNAQLVADYKAMGERMKAIEDSNGQLSARIEAVAKENTELSAWQANAAAATSQTAAVDAANVTITTPNYTESQKHLMAMVDAKQI